MFNKLYVQSYVHINLYVYMHIHAQIETMYLYAAKGNSQIFLLCK